MDGVSFSTLHRNILINIQNLGIVIAFGAFFTTALLIFTQFNTSLSTDTAVTLYKRGSKRHPRISGPADEENGPTSPSSLNEKGPASPKPGDEDIVPPMTDVFSWQHVNYTVPIPGKVDRQLLSDVSGYVAPGKLTALMGESGAGKTTLLNVLAQRTNVGVVTGDRFVNGQPLPHDFQSQTYAFFTAFLSLNGLTFHSLQWILPADGYPRPFRNRSRGSSLLCQTASTGVCFIGRERSLR